MTLTQTNDFFHILITCENPRNLKNKRKNQASQVRGGAGAGY
jgi:hypothetical protein